MTSGSSPGATASGSAEIRVEGASTVAVKETAKSTVTESSGSTSVRTTRSGHEITGERLLLYIEIRRALTLCSTARDYILSRN